MHNVATRTQSCNIAASISNTPRDVGCLLGQTCSSNETGGRAVTRSRRASAWFARARQPISGAAESTVPPELAQCESVKLTERLLTVLPSDAAESNPETAHVCACRSNKTEYCVRILRAPAHKNAAQV